jgi:hypothetical protein
VAFFASRVGLTGLGSRLTGVSGVTVGDLHTADAIRLVYAVTNLRRRAHKFARPISTITWAVFLASPR